MFVDSHAHLQLPHFKDDLEQAISRAKDAEIEAIMLVGSDEADSLAGVLLAAGHDFMYASVGIHPHDVKNADDNTYNNIKKMVRDHTVHAYGEIGLDFFKNYSPRDTQIEHFERQLDIADELSLPLIIHIRDAYDDSYNILNQKKDKLRNGGVIHCFSSDYKNAAKFIDLGFHISFSGTITYKKSTELVETARKISINDTLIETDAPYLSPVPYRGKRNEPAYVKEVAKFIAEINGLSVEDVGRITSRNFYDLFRIESPMNDTKITYKIRNSLYINMTNRCTNSCTFCARENSYVVKGHNLLLGSEPTVEQIISLIGDPTEHDEVVFCGYGEPLIRLDAVIAVARYVKERGGKVRVNTNGQANMIHKKNILESLRGLVDAISVSLNSDKSEQYNEICHSIFGTGSYNEVKSFILQAKDVIPDVTASIVELPGVDVAACRKIAEEELGVNFKVRKFNVVG